MKKSLKPLIAFSLSTFFLLSVFLLGYISVKIKCDQLAKDKVLKEEIINTEKNKQVDLTAKLQLYSSEERITEIASSELGMIKRTDPRIALEVSREKINMIHKKLTERYD